jgi:hypothetical protein
VECGLPGGVRAGLFNANNDQNRARQAAPYESESKLSHSKFLIGVWLALS